MIALPPYIPHYTGLEVGFKIKLRILVLLQFKLNKGRLQKKRVKRVTSSLKVGWVGAQNHISDRKEIVTKT